MAADESAAVRAMNQALAASGDSPTAEVKDKLLSYLPGFLLKSYRMRYTGTLDALTQYPIGKGKLVAGSLVYVGNWKDGRFDGDGVLENLEKGSSAERYTGTFCNGVYQGYGVLETKFERYAGRWRGGKMHGEGRLFSCKDGAYLYEGSWRDGRLVGWHRVTDWIGRVQRRRYDNGTLRETQVLSGKNRADTALTMLEHILSPEECVELPGSDLKQNLSRMASTSALLAADRTAIGHPVLPSSISPSAPVGRQKQPSSITSDVHDQTAIPALGLERQSIDESGPDKLAFEEDTDGKQVSDFPFADDVLVLLGRRHPGALLYSGQIDAAGFPSGEGRAVWPDSKCSYKGDWLCGVPHGVGVWIDRCAERSDDCFIVYEGDYVAGMRHGSGKLVSKDGVTTSGTFLNGEIEGWAQVSGKQSVSWKRFVDGSDVEESDQQPIGFTNTNPSNSAIKETIDILFGELERVRRDASAFAEQMALKTMVQQTQISEQAEQVEADSGRPVVFDDSTVDPGRSLGSGSYGRVFFFTHRITRGSYAAKIFFSDAAFEAEANIFDKLQRSSGHRNVVRMLGVGRLPDGPILVMPLYDGSLWDALADRRAKNVGWFSQSQLAGFCLQIVRGLSFLHRLGVAHRDLKTQNVLVRYSSAGLSDLSALVLTDFGVSTENPFAMTLAGTLIAPEILKTGGRGYDPMLADIFSFGAMLWEMLSAERLSSATLPLPSLPAGRFGSEFVGLKLLMSDCTDPEPSARLSLSGIQEQCELLENEEE